ncbi:MAG: hypothetical protein ACRD3G_27545, partial [Vicinamibacterales bacterium]
WRLIVDMLSHVVDLSAADMVMSELVNREPPAIDLADFFAASLKRSRGLDDDDPWLEETLLRLARIRQTMILSREDAAPRSNPEAV